MSTNLEEDKLDYKSMNELLVLKNKELKEKLALSRADNQHKDFLLKTLQDKLLQFEEKKNSFWNTDIFDTTSGSFDANMDKIAIKTSRSYSPITESGKVKMASQQDKLSQFTKLYGDAARASPPTIHTKPTKPTATIVKPTTSIPVIPVSVQPVPISTSSPESEDAAFEDYI